MRHSLMTETREIRKHQAPPQDKLCVRRRGSQRSKYLTGVCSLLLAFFPCSFVLAEKAIITATKKNDAAAVEAELQRLRKKNPSQGTAHERRALALARNNQNFEILKLWLDSGRFPEDDILHDAVEAHQWNVAYFLANQGVVPRDDTIELVLRETESAEHIKNMLQPPSRSAGRVLLLAIAEGKLELVGMLFEMGADVNYQAPSYLIKVDVFADGYSIDRTLDPRGMTSLGYAVQQGNIDLARQLLQKGADPNVRLITSTLEEMPTYGHSRLFIESLSHTGTMQLILGEGRRVVIDGSKHTRLGFGSPPPALLAIEGNQLSTPLITSITHEEIPQSTKAALVELLLGHGADVELADESGSTALWYAEARGDTQVLALLNSSILTTHETSSEAGDEENFLASSFNGDLAEVSRLLEQGVNVNHRFNHGATALYLATLRGNVEVVRALLAHGADANLRTDAGTPVLYIASGGGHEAVAEVLLANGADANLENSQGMTALFIAVKNGHEGTVELLLASRATIDHKRRDGVTPLIMASHQEHEKIARALLKGGANVDHQSGNGMTALMAASRQGNQEIVSMLLEAGAEVNLEASVEGGTALMMASQNGHEEIVGALLESDADVYSDGADDVITEFGYRGCFKDRPARDLKGFRFKDRGMTVKMCVSTCKKRGFAVAAVQFSAHCFCDDSFGRYGPALNCDMPCGGELSATCGGRWANGVFMVP